MAGYKSMTFENPYAENVYEDLTISKETAEFQMEQAAQQRANIMQGLRGAAGSTGISALAQQLANAGTLQARQSSADIAEQEAYNQKLAAQGSLQQQKGEDWVAQMERERQQNLLMARLGGTAGATDARQLAQQNQLLAKQAGQQQMAAAGIGAATSLASMSKEDWSKMKDTLGTGWGNLKSLFANQDSLSIGWDETGVETIDSV